MNRKRIVSFVLMMALLLGTIGFASEISFTDVDGNPHEDAILEMARLGILDGVGNNLFAPNGELNRAAAAKVAGYLLGYSEEDAERAAQEPPEFDDIVGTNHQWALGWINLMAEEGILRGVGANRYAPGDPLQMVHWSTILIRVLEQENPEMSWPNDYDDVTNFLGLDRGFYYNSTGVMNRAEMARMTTTALYDAQRPDGKRIFDVVTFKESPLDEWHVPTETEANIYSDATIEIELSNAVVQTGGNQTITITVTATQGTSNRPAAFTHVEFFASSGPHDRNDRLSVQKVITDADGVATSTYRTVAADDGNAIEILANIQTGENQWFERTAFALASNKAAMVSGRVVNPFNGEPVDDPEIIVALDGNPQNHTRFRTDDKGYFGGPINANRYSVDIRMNVGDSAPFSGEFKGSHFSINNEGDVWMAIQPKNYVEGNRYTIPSELGVVTGIHNQPVGTDIYLVRKSDQFTQIATIGSGGRFMIALQPGEYWIGNSVGSTLKDNVKVQIGTVTDTGTF